MIKRLLCGNNMRKVIAVCGIVALLVCLVPPSSAGTDASIVIANVKPTELLPGDTKEITLTVKNVGSNDAKQVTFNFQESQYISVVGPSSVSISSLGGWCSKDVTITVHVAKGAPSGSYTIPVTCTFSQYYSTGQGSVTEVMPEVSYSIVLQVTQGAIIDIADVVPSELKPGEETDLQFTIANIGNAPLQDLVFSWTEVDGVILPVSSDNTKHISHIDAGAPTVVTYTVVADVNADAGLYQLDLTIAFEDESGGSSAINTTVGIIVGGGTDFDVTVSESSDSRTSFSVANIGNNPAYSVTVKIPEQEQFAVQGSTASIVGNLDEGDYTIVSFQVTPASQRFGGTGAPDLSQQEQLSEEERQKLREEFSQRNASQSNNLQVAIDYTDTTGIRRTVEKTVPIQLTDISSDEAQFNPGMRQQQSIWNNSTLIGTIALVVLLIGGFIYYKRRKSINAFLTRSSREKKE
ncbi:MAG TPA: COG1361 S-layer family protein [Candidatus Bathyarchaeia archaeon]|nr:COG1361 S-layer family protein [Candidatus Bathyarchaeia archaeon]